MYGRSPEPHEILFLIHVVITYPSCKVLDICGVEEKACPTFREPRLTTKQPDLRQSPSSTTTPPIHNHPPPAQHPKMSSESAPISLPRFAAALNDLPISALYAKHAELTNSITHLESSNQQLEEFARENDDRDCYEALLENRHVMKNMQERMDAVKKEVEEVRGLPWRPRDESEVRKEEGAAPLVAGATATAQTNGAGPSQTNGTVAQAQDQGDSTAQGGDEEEGVYL